MRSPTQHATSPGLHTPHDALLADLHGQHQPREAVPLPKAENQPRSPPRLSVIPSVGSLERSDRTASPSQARSTTSTPGVAHEPLPDPFSGNLAGLMVPKKDNGRDATPSQLDQRRDELWAGLASIRELQSEVAGMHVQMEGIGLSDVRGGKRAAGAVGRAHPETIPVGEEWDEPDGAEAAAEEQRKKARDAEFTNLAETFKGRREAIDAIMNKLGELSDELTRFHALHTPVMDFAPSRNTTKDSQPVSPDLANAASPSTSPELPPALPKFVLGEPDRAVFHESPISALDELPHPSTA